MWERPLCVELFVQYVWHLNSTYPPWCSSLDINLLVIKDELHRVAGFPNVFGCIDGTHIPIKAPPINEVICEATQITTNVEAKWPGSVHHARIFRESSLCQTFQQGQYNGYLLGDRGYPCLPYLMTPYPEPEPGPQTRFNLAHSRTRPRWR
ncbi:putative nuclease HARBI1 isoform X2 [Tachysurus fulvidraco]|uniref:putative nuclease HARBI1 isoform X2 n=1 Tax=Tachysurus fulvidraco TaxID=1234273 RepID=UPI001FED72FE|nr:putative nuclease HARBI1 isoform X2 [Tachysurus fulvidraco]